VAHYILRRLLLLPITLFFIVVVNFAIINMAPGEPTSVTEISPGGEARRQENGAVTGDERYLQFRERYGLTLPILFNTWPNLSQEYVKATLETFLQKKEYSFKHLQDLRTRLQRNENREISKQNLFLREHLPSHLDTEQNLQAKILALSSWYQKNQSRFEPTLWQKFGIFFTETRFFRYFSRVLTLDFGTLRDDPTKTVVSEVISRFKYSLTLSVTPLIITFFLCLFFGFLMALNHNSLLDHGLNTLFLILYAIPIFVVAPFLIEEVAMKFGWPFSGFTSPESIYEQETSLQRLFDIARHIFLPIVAIMYGSLATQTRLARTAVLEVAKQDYVRTARAKGLTPSTVVSRYIGRNASITIVTAIAGSLGVILGGSLIVETLFEIDGFGKFFYDAVLNRDYNVIMFSAIAGSFLALVGYLLADIAYMLLDPRVSLE